jgi:hypothetical protein
MNTNSGSLNDIYYTMRDSGGGVIKPVTRFTADTPGSSEGYYYPNLAGVSNSRALLVWYRASNRDIYYAVLDNAGNTLKGATNVSTGYGGWGPDAVQLSSGNILIAWGGFMGFAVLDHAYNRIAGPTWLFNPAAITGDAYVSVAADATGHTILSWMDYDSSYRRNLYYALVNGNGTLLTPPMIFRTAGPAFGSPYIETGYGGYGNTSYTWTPPSAVDGVVSFAASFFGGPPGGSAGVRARYANHGITTATGVVLTATLDSNLTYEGDTLSITPTVSGNDVIWNLPDLGFLEDQDFTLQIQVPAGATYGTRYPITLTLTSAGPEANAGDNTASAEVMAAMQTYLPLIQK